MVMDRMFLWIFTLAVFGNIFIIYIFNMRRSEEKKYYASDIGRAFESFISEKVINI